MPTGLRPRGLNPHLNLMRIDPRCRWRSRTSKTATRAWQRSLGIRKPPLRQTALEGIPESIGSSADTDVRCIATLDDEMPSRSGKRPTPKGRTSMPTFIPPMLATLVGGPFDDPTGCSRSSGTVSGSRRSSTVGESGCGPAARRTRRSRYFGPFLEPPTWLDARQAVVDGEVIALDDRGRARLRPAPGPDQGEGTGRRADPVRLRGLRPPPPRRPIAPRRAARGAPPTPGRRPPPGSARPPERAHRGRRDRVLRGGQGSRPRGDHGQGPPLAVRARQADRPLAEDQDPARAGARRRRLGEGRPARRSTSVRSSSASTRTAGCATRARSARASRTTNRAELLAAVAPLATPTRRRSRRRSRAPPRGTPSGSAPSSSSGPSSPAGRATASSARRPTRASSSRRTRAPFAGRWRAHIPRWREMCKHPSSGRRPHAHREQARHERSRPPSQQRASSYPHRDV